MSDPNTGAAPTDEQYVSQIDPAFADAWNQVYNPETPAPPADGTIEIDTPGSGTPPPAPAPEGVGAEPPAAPAPDPGAPAGAPTVPATPAAPSAPVVGTGEGLDVATVTPYFATASNQIQEKMEESFKATALSEVRESIDEKFLDVLKTRPMLLVGEKVPNLKDRSQPEILLRDSTEAKEYQETLAGLLQDEVDDLVAQKIDGVRPMMNVIQESILMFQNNQDLIPGTKQYDPELAKRFTDIAKSYELRVNDKLMGYQVNVQPLINSLRSDLIATRAVAGAQQPAAPAAAAAAPQPRAQNGQFEAPQAGIPSKAGLSGEAGEDDYSTFWSAAGMPNVNI